jgi:hypothetical protein
VVEELEGDCEKESERERADVDEGGGLLKRVTRSGAKTSVTDEKRLENVSAVCEACERSAEM